MRIKELDFENEIYGLNDDIEEQIETNEYYGLHVICDCMEMENDE